jgi:hypothetical protein
MRFQGLGLGLFISSEILKGHHGDFWLESRPGQGSIFFFRLPLPEHFDNIVRSNTPTLYQDDFINIHYDAARALLEVDWRGFQNMETVKRGGMKILEMLKENKCHKVLNDNTHVLGSWSEAADWASAEWFPMMENAGLQKFAWIYSASVFSRLSAQKSVNRSPVKIAAQFFPDKISGIEWISD